MIHSTAERDPTETHLLVAYSIEPVRGVAAVFRHGLIVRMQTLKRVGRDRFVSDVDLTQRAASVGKRAGVRSSGDQRDPGQHLLQVRCITLAVSTDQACQEGTHQALELVALVALIESSSSQIREDVLNRCSHKGQASPTPGRGHVYQ